MKNIYVPIPPRLGEECEILECDDTAVWLCYPQGITVRSIPLCEKHKRMAEEGEKSRNDETTF